MEVMGVVVEVADIQGCGEVKDEAVQGRVVKNLSLR